MRKRNNGLWRVHAVDLFCGIGGLTHGLGMSGIDVKAGFDIDPSCRYAYETNNHGSEFIATDVRSIHFRDIAPYYKDADFTVMVGCAPCQPFSAHTRRTQNSQVDNYSLVRKFTSLVKEGTPDLVSMENVPGLVKQKAFDELLATLNLLGYQYDYDILPCANYGVPQNRKRLVLLASGLGEISLPCPRGRKQPSPTLSRVCPHLKTDRPRPMTPLTPRCRCPQKTASGFSSQNRAGPGRIGRRTSSTNATGRHIIRHPTDECAGMLWHPLLPRNFAITVPGGSDTLDNIGRFPSGKRLCYKRFPASINSSRKANR